jgi:drug/metabolite transporter (DMT)-like permease
MPLLGELAALATAAAWAVASLLFAAAAQRLGPFTLNQARITVALAVLSTLLALTRGVSWAPGARAEEILLLAVSGLIGLTLGDWAYFGALVHLGPRLSTLLMTLAPPMTALLAWPVLGETLGPEALLGTTLILGGVAWVVLERPARLAPRGHRLRGVVCGILGSLGQALGLVLSKLGMAGAIDPLPATAIRMAAATAGVWAIALARGRAGEVARLRRDPAARWATLGASFLGPVFGVWMSLVAVRLTEAGIAATLMATTPILVLPLVRVVRKEAVSPRAAVGALAAVAGVALIFLR